MCWYDRGSRAVVANLQTGCLCLSKDQGSAQWGAAHRLRLCTRQAAERNSAAVQLGHRSEAQFMHAVDGTGAAVATHVLRAAEETVATTTSHTGQNCFAVAREETQDGASDLQTTSLVAGTMRPKRIE